MRCSRKVKNLRTMINFQQGNECFNYRIAGIALSEDRVLLHRAKGEAFWTCPGGRAEIGETCEQTLVREIKEELNENVEILRLLWVVENFFEYDRHNYHELAFYFLMQFDEQSRYLDKSISFAGTEDDKHLEFRWFPANSDVLTGLPLLPVFLQNSLCCLPDSVQHVIERS